MIKVENITKFNEEYKSMKEQACKALADEIQDMEPESISVIQAMLNMCDCAMELSTDMCNTINEIEKIVTAKNK